MSSRRPLALALVCAGVVVTPALGGLGCSPDGNTPVGAMKLFFRAVATRDQAKVYKLLAPETQKELKRWASLATSQTGERRRFKPEELLAPSIDQPRYRLGRIEALSEEGDRAKVKVFAAGKSSYSEIFELARVDGAWRVVLPAKAFVRPEPKPASAPVSRPSSSPTSRGASSAPASTPTSTPTAGDKKRAEPPRRATPAKPVKKP